MERKRGIKEGMIGEGKGVGARRGKGGGGVAEGERE